MRDYPLNYGSRQETELTLQPLEGAVPTDLGGYVFVNSAAGTVNYPTPAPENWPDGSPCPEYGATNLNGDGMVYRFDFTEVGQVRVKTGLLRTPCYHADRATRYGTNHYAAGLHFKSAGLSRTHPDLGNRNQLNTAVIPFRFGADEPAHLSVAFDAGRPYVLDPLSLELVTPIGRQPEWLHNFPREMEQVFPMIYATAHPAFDPYTFDYYTVNYKKSIPNLMTNVRLDERLAKATHFIGTELERFAHWVFGQRLDAGKLLDAVRQFVPFLNDKHAAGHQGDFGDHYQGPEAPPLTSELRLVHWKGGALNSWRVTDAADGTPVVIDQTMHAMDLTEDYIVLSDSTLKFAMDLLMSLPFGHNDRLNDLLRRMATHTIRPTTPCFIIRRADLEPDAGEVKAVRCELPHETIHFSLDYRNPEGLITLYAGHNSAICGGEWIRPFDRLATDPDRRPPAGHVGSMATSVMDISRFGKHVIRAADGELLDTQLIHRRGFAGDDAAKLTGPHTWGAGLSTFRGQYSVAEKPDRIRHVYQQFDGLEAEALTQFVYDLYKDYNAAHGLVPAEQLLAYHRHGVPGCLCRIDTARMTIADHYTARRNERLQSLQFIPRRRAAGDDNPAELQTDGYIAALMMVGHPHAPASTGYRRQLYLFDAADLAAGPVCKLGHDELAWSQTIHGVYCDEITRPTLDYRVDVREDYNWVLDRFLDEDKQQEMRAFMEAEVYPHYSSTAP